MNWTPHSWQEKTSPVRFEPGFFTVASSSKSAISAMASQPALAKARCPEPASSWGRRRKLGIQYILILHETNCFNFPPQTLKMVWLRSNYFNAPELRLCLLKMICFIWLWKGVCWRCPFPGQTARSMCLQTTPLFRRYHQAEVRELADCTVGRLHASELQ